MRGCVEGIEVVIYPSDMPLSMSFRYCSQRSPITCDALVCARVLHMLYGGTRSTFPQEKQRTGIIILTAVANVRFPKCMGDRFEACTGVCGVERLSLRGVVPALVFAMIKEKLTAVGSGKGPRCCRAVKSSGQVGQKLFELSAARDDRVPSPFLPTIRLHIWCE